MCHRFPYKNSIYKKNIIVRPFVLVKHFSSITPHFVCYLSYLRPAIKGAAGKAAGSAAGRPAG